ADLLRQADLVAAHHRAEGAATAAELRHARRAVAGAAGALLCVHLLAGGGGVSAGLDRLGGGAAPVELPHHAAVKDVGARLETEDRVRERDRAGIVAVERGDLEIHHAPSFGASAAGAASAWVASLAGAASAPGALNLPGFGRSFGAAFFTASRT